MLQPKISLGGKNARVIPLQVGKQAIQKWQRAEFEFDYSKRPRICPKDFISKCYKAPYLEIKGKPVRKCLTMCKGKPCFKPCICECLPKYKVKFSKAIIPYLLLPVDKRQLIPSCNFNHMVSCRAQIYGEATNELCALGCGEGVCPLTCNCQCVPDTTPFNFPNRVSSGIDRGEQFRPMGQFIPGTGVGFGLDTGAEPIPDLGVQDLGNGIILEGIGMGGSGNGVGDWIGNGNGLDLNGLGIDFNGVEFIGADANGLGVIENGGVDIAGSATAGGGALMISDGAGDVFGNVQSMGRDIGDVLGKNQGIGNGAGGRTIITDGADGVVLDNGVSIIRGGGGGSAQPIQVIDAPINPLEPLTLFTPVDGHAPGASSQMPPDIVTPLQGIETETVQVKIDVQGPTAPGQGGPVLGDVMANTPGDVLVHNSAANAANAGPGDVLVHNSALMGNGQGGGQNGIPVQLPQDKSAGIVDWNAGGSGGGNGWNSGVSSSGWNEGTGGGGWTAGAGVDQGFQVGGQAMEQGGGMNNGGQGGGWDSGNQGGFLNGGNQGSLNSGQNQGSGNGGGANVQQGKNGGLKLNIPPSGNKQGGAINLDLSGILNQISGAGGEGIGMGGGEGGGLFNNPQAGSPFDNLFVSEAGNQAGGSPFDLFGNSQKRSDTSPLSKLGTELPFDAFNLGSMSGLGGQGVAGKSGTDSSKNGLDTGMASMFSALMGGIKPEPEDRCLKGTTKTCTATIEWSHTPGLDKWCSENCPKGVCDKERCSCTCLTQDEIMMSKMA